MSQHGEQLFYLAVLSPYPCMGVRPVTLRPTFSSGLPFSSSRFFNAFPNLLICFTAVVQDGSFEVCPAVLPPYPLRRLRSVTLRPTFSSGLPFSSSRFFNAFLNLLICFVAVVQDGSFEVCPAVLPPYLLRRLRSVTLRPTLSSGLPFYGFYYN